MKEALEQDVDLIEYGTKIETDLMSASKGSVADYISESAHLANLHTYVRMNLQLFYSCSTMDACDALLAEIQELLHVYQKDLSGVANEIRSLQVCLNYSKWGDYS